MLGTGVWRELGVQGTGVNTAVGRGQQALYLEGAVEKVPVVYRAAQHAGRVLHVVSGLTGKLAA